mmetsp:Transcript_47749/g.120357  ORF Transcript_47749/g.120357 Transcript_47749/m.120357 type:complete len:206 (+) Transcript_47749:450-1067(+)
MVWRLCMRAGDGGPVSQARLVFHVLRACDVVRRWIVRFLRGLVHLLQGGGAVRHGAVALGRQARDRFAVVASLHCAALLLALLLLPYSHRLVVCCHELLSALRDVRVLRPDDDEVPQAHHPVCDLHHAGAASADACRDVCDHQGYDVAGYWRGVPREQDELRAGLDNVCQLLPALLQALRGELRDPDAQAWRRECWSSPEEKIHG